MAIPNINDNPKFKTVAEPLKNIPKEIQEVDQRLQAIHDELVRTASSHGNAWDIYLSENQQSTEQRATLRAEAEKLSNRKTLLEAALQRGRVEVDSVRGQLSREPCKEARPRMVEQIKKILAARNEIESARNEMRGIRQEIEDAGYLTALLPAADFNMDNFDGYQWYVRHNYPEIPQSK